MEIVACRTQWAMVSSSQRVTIRGAESHPQTGCDQLSFWWFLAEQANVGVFPPSRGAPTRFYGHIKEGKW